MPSKEQQQIIINRSSTFLLLRFTRVMCAFSSSVCASGKGTRRRVDTVSQSHWPHPFTKTGFPSVSSLLNFRLTGSLSSLLHEKYSCNERVERVTDSLSGTIRRASYSLIVHTKGVSRKRKLEFQHRLGSFLLQ